MACFVYDGNVTLMCDKCGKTIFKVKYHPTDSNYDQHDGFTVVCYKCQGKHW